MSRQFVARALEHLVDGYVLSRIVLNEVDMSLTHISLGAPALAALIRAVDAQYPEGYDEAEGLELDYDEGGLCTYMVCETCGQRKTHAPTCRRWNTRVALLALCRDITGEKG